MFPEQLCRYPDFGEVSIAAGCKENLSVYYMVQLIYSSVATFKSLRLREKPEKNKVQFPAGGLLMLFTPTTVYKSQI